MPRTTLNLDATVLDELKALQKRDRKTLGELASELLARSLAESEKAPIPETLEWHTQAMGAKVDLSDKEALNRILDGTTKG